MKKGDFELCIVNGLETPGTNEVEMRHGQVYQLALSNHGLRRAEASVAIDGKKLGAWRLSAGQTIVLERPVDQEGRFTFFRLDSTEAKAANIPKDADAGSIFAAFWPELEAAESFDDVDDPATVAALAEMRAALEKPAEPKAQPPRDGAILAAAAPERISREGMNPGGTALTGKSTQ